MEILSILLAVFTFVGLVYAVFINKEILRENGGNTPYSFARFQIALWSIVIIPAFCLNWGYASPDLPGINETGLILLGISAGSALSSSIVKSTLRDRSAALQAPRLKMDSTSKRFWSDIISDDMGNLSVVRLQNLMFTFVYIVIYVAIFIKKDMQYPDFDDQAFLLMGISSGTYVLGRSMYR